MKVRNILTAYILLICIILPACSSGNIDNAGTSAQSGNTTQIDNLSQKETTAEQTTPKKYLPKPYVDIEFSEDGKVFDTMDHLSCELEDKSKGSVVNENVPIDGKEYKFPHLYVKEKGGVVRCTYKNIKTKTELFDLLSDGLTLEAMVLNYNKFTSSSSEQMIVGTCQSGGYNFSCYKGAYTFSVYTGGAYRSAHNPSGVINDSMTHLIGVYDPISKTSTLYVNGEKVSSVSASGTFGLATGDLWRQIILGGDITNDFGVHILASNFRLADYKIYPSAMTTEEVATAYEQMKVKFMGEKTDYDLEYYDGNGADGDKGDRLFASLDDSYADVYEPDSSLVNSPTVITYATKDNYSKFASAAIRPATCIFTVKVKDGKLYAYAKDGTEIAPLYDAVKALDTKVIPAFAVEDGSISKLVSDFINYNRIGDVFVISSNADIIKNICTATRSARPILDMSSLNAVNVNEVHTKVAACGAKTVMLKATALTPENVTRLRALAESVFLVAEKGKANAHDAIFKGAMGIVTEEANELISVIESFKNETLCFPTLLVAHRGDMQNCPQNVLRSFVSAAQSGAPITELDVYLTKDNHLAINHDATTTHWDKKLTCTESTRAELKALKNTEANATAEDTFTFLDEVFEYFSKNYTDMIFHVEIKDKRNAVVDKAVALAKQYGMFDRVFIICNNHDIVSYASQTYGIGVQMIRSYIYDKSNVRASLAFACEEVVSLNSSYYTVWADSVDALNVALRHRGIKYCTWTTTTASATDSDYARGYVEFTSNTPHRCDKYARYIKAEVDSAGNVKVTRINYDGSTSDVTSEAKLIVISGNVSFSGGKISGSGSFAFSYSTSVGNYKYDLCSLSLTK